MDEATDIASTSYGYDARWDDVPPKEGMKMWHRRIVSLLLAGGVPFLSAPSLAPSASPTCPYGECPPILGGVGRRYVSFQHDDRMDIDWEAISEIRIVSGSWYGFEGYFDVSVTAGSFRVKGVDMDWCDRLRIGHDVWEDIEYRLADADGVYDGFDAARIVVSLYGPYRTLIDAQRIELVREEGAYRMTSLFLDAILDSGSPPLWEEEREPYILLPGRAEARDS